jgi:hypothetical protein
METDGNCISTDKMYIFIKFHSFTEYERELDFEITKIENEIKDRRNRTRLLEQHNDELRSVLGRRQTFAERAEPPLKMSKTAAHSSAELTPKKKIDLPIEKVFLLKFFKRYVGSEGAQKFNALNCSICEKRFKKSVDCLRHFITHFPNHIKFDCPGCGKNFTSLHRLRDHTEKSKDCTDEDYPEEKFFHHDCLDDHPEQAWMDLKCSICGKQHDEPYHCRDHFMTCVKYTFECPLCGTIRTAYRTAKEHFLECSGEAPHRKYGFFRDHPTPPPIADKSKQYTQDEMMTMIETDTLPQIDRLRERYPKGALMTIGMTVDPMTRDRHYNQQAAVYRKVEADPPLRVDEQILFKVYSRFSALQFEYLVQYHLGDSEGKFYEKYGKFMNEQQRIEPKNAVDNERAHYVYIKFTKIPFIWKHYDDDDGYSYY